MTSKVVYELLIRSYERFMYFSQTWNLTISKNTNVNNGNVRFIYKGIFYITLKAISYYFSLFQSEWTNPHEKPFSPFGVQW